MQKLGYATKCMCNDIKCNLIFNNDFDFCWMMNELRALLLWYIKKICETSGVDFHIRLDYFEFEDICKEIDNEINDITTCVLTTELEKIYQGHK